MGSLSQATFKQFSLIFSSITYSLIWLDMKPVAMSNVHRLAITLQGEVASNHVKLNPTLGTLMTQVEQQVNNHIYS